MTADPDARRLVSELKITAIRDRFTWPPTQILHFVRAKLLFEINGAKKKKLYFAPVSLV